MIRGNRGQVLMLVGLMLVVLVGFAALGIDVAYMYSVRHELQRCADSGALAGATWFIDNSAFPLPPAGTPEGWASQYAMMDNVANAPLTAVEVDVVVSVADNQVRVVTQRTVDLFFARIWQPSLLISAAATADGRIIPDPPNPDRRIVRLIE